MTVKKPPQTYTEPTFFNWVYCTLTRQDQITFLQMPFYQIIVVHRHEWKHKTRIHPLNLLRLFTHSFRNSSNYHTIFQTINYDNVYLVYHTRLSGQVQYNLDKLGWMNYVKIMYAYKLHYVHNINMCLCFLCTLLYLHYVYHLVCVNLRLFKSKLWSPFSHIL